MDKSKVAIFLGASLVLGLLIVTNTIIITLVWNLVLTSIFKVGNITFVQGYGIYVVLRIFSELTLPTIKDEDTSMLNYLTGRYLAIFIMIITFLILT